MEESASMLAREARRAGVLIYASVQFVLLTGMAMLAYPGGAVYEADRGRYLFLGNFFSDLGATVTPSGRPNLLSHVLFVVALATVGVALALSSSNWRVPVARLQQGVTVGFASQWAEIAAGAGFIGIAVTPWNLVLEAHNLCVRAAFGCLLIYDLCLLVIQLRNRWPAFFTVVNATYLLVLLGYVYILFAGPRLDTRTGLEFQVAAQKIIVYASIVNLGLQALSVRLEVRRAAGTDRRAESA